ncbi:hypothetical protein [Chelativorans sp. AA-79]|uniref:hypothetical protein n=1 Tax=Chelativorans sp. AA-79 TaxID=3028735 RepID=UPI0002D9C361|nr:hypothetical protein [Chelativorans sp. AA-79]WEX10800.1 hypothetical protein PVE73_07645 [Chelativorans sp. AA-79]
MAQPQLPDLCEAVELALSIAVLRDLGVPDAAIRRYLGLNNRELDLEHLAKAAFRPSRQWEDHGRISARRASAHMCNE